MSDVTDLDPVDLVETDDGQLAVEAVPPDCDADAGDDDEQEAGQ